MRDKVEIGFMYKNEFGALTEVKKVTEYNSLEENELDMLIGEFKKFLICTSFPAELVDRVGILEEK